MKKILSIIILFLIFYYQAIAYVNFYTLTPSDKIIVNKISSKIEKLLSKNNLIFRKNLEIKINEIQSRYSWNKQLYAIFEQVKINNHLISYKHEYLNHYSEYNIDFNAIKKTWIDWHNIERSKLGITHYSYDERLDNTGYEWSKQQDGEKIMSHKRSPDGPYYDYHEIEEWFNDRWVRCEVISGATTSESIGKYGYFCKSWENCTQKLQESLKTIFDIYMSEKWLPYPQDAHYRWIVKDNFTKMWLGIRISIWEQYDNLYNYYVTTHYCTKFKQ